MVMDNSQILGEYLHDRGECGLDFRDAASVDTAPTCILGAPVQPAYTVIQNKPDHQTH